MDDSEVVMLGPQSANKEAVEDTLQESELESARMENIIQSKMTEQLTGATRREMRQLVDKCVSKFSDRIENMLANFENRLGANGKVAVLFCNLFRFFL
jgi:glutamyl-tRNA reductase